MDSTKKSRGSIVFFESQGLELAAACDSFHSIAIHRRFPAILRSVSGISFSHSKDFQEITKAF